MIKIKRIYDDPIKADGVRILKNLRVFRQGRNDGGDGQLIEI